MIEAGHDVTRPNSAALFHPSALHRVPPAFYLGLLAIALGYAVFHDGGMVLMDWNISLLILGLVGVLYWCGNRPASLSAMDRALRWAVLLLPVYVALQLVPLPLFLLRVLSPARAGLTESLGSVMRLPWFAPLTIASGATFAYLFRIIAYTLTFLLMRDITSRSSAKRLWVPTIPLLAIGSVEAIWGLLQNTNGNEVQGSYGNKNHFAGLLEMTLPLAIMYGIALLRSGYSRLRSSTALVLKATAVFSVGAMIFAALLYSMSRMAVVATLCGLFAMGGLAVFTQRVRPWKKLLAGGCLAVFLLLVLVYLPPDELIKRFGNLVNSQPSGGEGRWPIWTDTLRLIGSYPLFGCGLGNYDVAFLKYQTSVVDRDFTFAHNDFLELAAELGAVGFIIVATLMLGIFATAVRAVTRAPNTRCLGLGCVGAISAISIHSLADFNMYIPANALLLSWISGIAAGLPSRSAQPNLNAAFPNRVFFRKFAIVVSSLLVVYAPARILLQLASKSEPRAVGAVPKTLLLEELRRDPAAPDRWCDLGEARLQAGEERQARYCFAQALALGPNIPPVQLRAAEFYYRVHETKLALKQTSLILERTETYDSLIFDWYKAKNLPVTEILSHGLPGGPRASQAYLRYLMGIENTAGSVEAWNWAVSHSYADDRLAVEYVDYLFKYEEYQAAAESWARYAGGRDKGYPESNHIFNGDFESNPTGSRFDWTIDAAPGATVGFDHDIHYSGRRSLRIQFDGTQNVSNIGVRQMVFLKPGNYRFQAYIRTKDISTDEGVAVTVVDNEAPKQLNFTTENLLGSNDWKLVEHSFQAPAGTGLVEVRLARKPSLRFDNLIRGTVWVDQVSISSGTQIASGGVR